MARRKKTVKERQRENSRQYYLENLTYFLWKNAKVRAARFKIPFTIKPKDIVIPNFCPVLGLPLQPGEGSVAGGSPTVDRFYPTLGYTHDNITVISHRANTLKGDGTAHEHRQIATWMDAHPSFEETIQQLGDADSDAGEPPEP